MPRKGRKAIEACTSLDAESQFYPPEVEVEQRISAYSPDSEEYLTKHRIYMSFREKSCPSVSHSPQNVDELRTALSARRNSLSLSLLSQADFEESVWNMNRAESEARVIASIIPGIAGVSCIPMHVLQNHGLETPSYDGIARTFTAVYQQGMLTIHAHHATAPSFKGTQPDYHMTQIGAFAITHSVESYIAGVTAFRNVRDIAARYRDEVIAEAKKQTMRCSLAGYNLIAHYSIKGFEGEVPDQVSV